MLAEHDRQAQRPDVPAEERLREEENVEMERPVIIRRVVAVEPGPPHLVDEPAVDPLVEVRRLHAQQQEAQERAQRDDAPRRPVHLREPLPEGSGGAARFSFSSRGLGSAAR